ncbi:predicted protein, partial [Nematostella vectensis]
IKDNQISASSKWNSNQGARHGRLDAEPVSGGQRAAWCPGGASKDQWIQIDLLQPTKVTGIITQGRNNNYYNQWVTTYKVEYGQDGNSFQSYDGGHIFSGNEDKNSKVKHIFKPSINARFIRVNPQTFHSGICMRIELLCNSNQQK